MEYLKLIVNLYFLIFFHSLLILIILRVNLLLIIIAIELGVFSLSYIFLVYSLINDQIILQVYVLVLLVIAACEASIGLGLFIQYYRINGTLDVDYLNNIKG